MVIDGPRAALIHHPWEHARSFYCSRNRANGIFHNKADFGVFSAVLEALSVVHSPSEPLILFAAGLFDGSDLLRLVRMPWWRRNASRVYGWEIQWAWCHSAKVGLSRHPEVRVSCTQGVSDAPGVLQMNGQRQTAGLYDCWREWGCGKGRTQEVPVVRWADVLEEQALRRVDYAMLDVEGSEVRAIMGMNLPQLARRFPIIQYELGATWADRRHATNVTQVEMARFLEAHGYILFLIGDATYHVCSERPKHCNGSLPLLLPVDASFFRDTHLAGAGCTRWAPHSRPNVVGGNALAVHTSTLYAGPIAAALRGVLALLTSRAEGVVA